MSDDSNPDYAHYYDSPSPEECEADERMRRDHEAMEFLRENPQTQLYRLGRFDGRWCVCGPPTNHALDGEGVAPDLTNAILAYRDEVQRRKESP